MRQDLAMHLGLDRAATELERGGDPRGVGRADAADLRELAWRRTRHRRHSAGGSHDVRRDDADRTRTRAGAEHDREQLLVAEHGHAALPQSLAWPLAHARDYSK